MSRSLCFGFLLGICLTLCPSVHAQSIQTVAGGGTDDGRPATLVVLISPTGVAVDSAGNLYIADRLDHRIRKVDARTGVISSVAGVGARGFSGDGGPATAAALDVPSSVTLDASGNVYIADSQNHRVRKVDAATKIITTVAGGAAAGFSGDGGAATAASLLLPGGVALDASGNLFIADSSHRIRMVDRRTQIITTVAGGAAAGFSGDGGPATAAALNFPAAVAVDSSGNVYIADSRNHRIRRVDALTKIITTAAGSGVEGFSGDGGPATPAALNSPTGVAVDTSGNLYIADWLNQRIRKVAAATKIITTVAGSEAVGFSGDEGPATAAALNGPVGLAVDAPGNVYIADTFNRRIRKVDVTEQIIATVAGSGAQGFSGDGGPAAAAVLNRPAGVAIDAPGNLYISDSAKHNVRKVDAVTKILTTVAGSAAVGFSGDGGPATAAALDSPEGVVLDAFGNLYIADAMNHRIRRVDAVTQIITTVAGNGIAGFSGDGGAATAATLGLPTGLAVDASGNLYVAEVLNHRIRRVDAVTQIITTVAGNGIAGFSGDGGAATVAAVHLPDDVTVDASGNLYIADSFNNRIRKVDATTRIITTVAGSERAGFSGDGGPATAAALLFPRGVAVDASGNLYIADGNHRVRKVDPRSIITTVAGTGTPGFSGDGGPATAAAIAAPKSVTVDPSGNLFIADESNRIRAVFACVQVGPPQLASPSDGSLGVSNSPRLAWNPVRGAFRYDVYLDALNPPKQIIALDIATTTFAPSNLEPLKAYYWQVVAKGDPFCVPFSTAASEIRSFTTAGTCTTPGSFDINPSGNP